MTPAMARAHTPTLSPQMFRHFAVITVVITGLIAMFADGEGRAMIEEQAHKAEQRSQMQAAEAAKADSARREVVSRNNKGDSRGWDSDPSPPAAPRSAAGTARANPYIRNGRPIVRRPPTVAVAHDSALTMTPEEMDRTQRQPMVDISGVSQQQRDQLLESSLRRSGGSGMADF